MFRQLIRMYREAYAGLPRASWILALISFVNRCGTMVMFFMTLYLTRELHYPVEEAGWLMGIYGSGSLAGSFLGGWLTDRLGNRIVQTGSLFGCGILYIALAFPSGYPALATLLFLAGVVNSAIHPAILSGISLVCPPEIRTRGFALERLAVNLGIAIGPVAGGYLAQIDYDLIFWVDGLTSLAAFLLFVAILPPSLLPARAPASRMAGEAAAGPAPVLPETRQTPWRDGYFLGVMALTLLSNMVFIQLFSTFPVYLRSFYNLLESQIGQVITVNTIIIVVFEMILLHRIRDIHPLRLAGLGAALTGAGFALLPLGNTMAFAILLTVVWTMGEIFSLPVLTAFVANRASDRTRGTYMGIFGTTFSLALLAGPVAGTALFDWSPAGLWYVCGITGVVAGTCLAVLSRVRLRQPTG